MAHIIFKDILVVFETGAAAPKNNEKNVETSPWVCPWLSPLVVNLQSKIKEWRLRKWMNATPGNNKSSRKTKKDAFQQTNLENSSPTKSRRIHQHHQKKREYPYPLFIQDSETHHHKNQPLLPQEGQAKGGLPITKETCHKDGKGLPPSKTKPPFFQKVKQKEEEPASSKHFLFIQGSPNQIGSLE